jgi:DUF1009 family protein
MNFTPLAPPSTLGIIAGSGELPRMLIHACNQKERPYFVIALENEVDEETIDLAGEHVAKVRLGAIGKSIDLLRRHHVQEIVMAGKVHRPKISQLRPDMKGTKLLARIGSAMLVGDNTLLNHILHFLEEEGFSPVGAEEIAQDLLTPEGLIGALFPDKRSQKDIEYGASIARGIGALDIGQAAIIQDHQVLGIEAIEGTDALIRRCAALKPEERGGVLIKVKKPQQERRIDLPTIGISTVTRVAECGFAGIAVEAGSSLIIDKQAVAKLADQLGIFVIGFSIDEGEPIAPDAVIDDV